MSRSVGISNEMPGGHPCATLFFRGSMIGQKSLFLLSVAVLGAGCDGGDADSSIADRPLAGTIRGAQFEVDGVFAQWVRQPRGLPEILSIHAISPTPTCSAPLVLGDARGVLISLTNGWPLPVGSEHAVDVALVDGTVGSGSTSRVKILAATDTGGTIAVRSVSALGEVEGRLSFEICKTVPASTWNLAGKVGDLDLELLGSVQMARLTEPDQTRVIASNAVFWCDYLETDACPAPSADEEQLRELTIILPGHTVGTFAVKAVGSPSAGTATVRYVQLDAMCVIDDPAHPYGVQGTSGTVTVDAIDGTDYGDVSITVDVTMADGSHLTGRAHAVSCR